MKMIRDYKKNNLFFSNESGLKIIFQAESSGRSFQGEFSSRVEFSEGREVLLRRSFPRRNFLGGGGFSMDRKNEFSGII